MLRIGGYGKWNVCGMLDRMPGSKRAVSSMTLLGWINCWSSRSGRQSRADNLEREIQSKRDQTAAFRDAQTGVFNRLSRFFNAIIRAALGTDAAGEISFDGNGLKASVELGGERSTAAIDSLKVIAFDLAVMSMSIEGHTHLPAFLVHDSPREADLGLSVYHRLFQLARHLEETDASTAVSIHRHHHDEPTGRSAD